MASALNSESIFDPLGENTTELNQSSWPRRGGSISTPVLASQTRMVLSRDPETILDPSGENATERTELLWPLRGMSCLGPIFSTPKIIFVRELRGTFLKILVLNGVDEK